MAFVAGGCGGFTCGILNGLVGAAFDEEAHDVFAGVSRGAVEGGIAGVVDGVDVDAGVDELADFPDGFHGRRRDGARSTGRG